MIKLLDKSKVSFFDYFYLLCIIIYAGQASAFAREFGDIRTVGNAVALVLTFLFAVSKKISIRKEFLIFLGVFTLYSFLVIFSTNSFHYFLWGYSKWLIYFFVAYVICKGYGYRFVVLAETILLHLAIIGVVCWIVLLIAPGPFTRFLSSFSLTPFNDNERFTSANVLVYTVILSSASGEYGVGYSIIRNSGFAWEPGAFACFMCFGLCFNALRTNFKLKNNLPFVVFLIALASAQSTTGYTTFAIMLAVWLIYNRKFLWLLVLIPAFLYMMKLPFLGDKIDDQLTGFSDATLQNAGQGDSFDRLLSFRILWDEFLRHPILGYGFAEPDFEKYGLHTWSGIGRLLAQYGIIMSLGFFLLLINSARKLNKFFISSSGILLVIAMIGSMVSYMIWSFPFCVVFWLLCIFMEPPMLQTNDCE